MQIRIIFFSFGIFSFGIYLIAFVLSSIYSSLSSSEKLRFEMSSSLQSFKYRLVRLGNFITGSLTHTQFLDYSLWSMGILLCSRPSISKFSQ